MYNEGEDPALNGYVHVRTYNYKAKLGHKVIMNFGSKPTTFLFKSANRGKASFGSDRNFESNRKFIVKVKSTDEAAFYGPYSFKMTEQGFYMLNLTVKTCDLDNITVKIDILRRDLTLEETYCFHPTIFQAFSEGWSGTFGDENFWLEQYYDEPPYDDDPGIANRPR